MAGIETLGRTINVVPAAASVPISLKDAAGVTFICSGGTDGDTFTFKATSSYDGTETELETVTHYYTNASAAGADPWVLVNQASGTYTAAAAASGIAAVYIDGEDLPAGDDYVEAVPTGSGTVIAIVGDLAVQRTPPNLRVLSGSTS